MGGHGAVRGCVYGPVPSRRLGASLGVDVAPFKVCSYDCIYCQLGPTTTLTTERFILPGRLDTPVRPTFDERALPVSQDILAGLCAAFTPVAEVVAERPRTSGEAAGNASNAEREVLDLLQRRPCTVDDMAEGLDIHRATFGKVLAALEQRGLVHRVLRDGRVFWRALEPPAQGRRAP